MTVIRPADRERQARLEAEREEREAARLEREAEFEERLAAVEEEREQREAAREEERQQREAAREEERQQEEAEREEEREQSEAESREREQFDYDALVAEQWSSVVPYIDKITTTATTVTVRLNMGNADEDGIVVMPDGMTDRGMAIELCEMMKRRGVHDAVDILDPRDLALARTGILTGSASSPRTRPPTRSARSPVHRITPCGPGSGCVADRRLETAYDTIDVASAIG